MRPVDAECGCRSLLDIKTLITEQFELRRYKEDDRELFINLFTDKEVMKFVGDGPLSRQAAGDLWWKLTKELYPSGQNTIWAVFSRSNNDYLGHSSLRPRPQNPDQWEIGYILRKEFWGNGYATEIAEAIVGCGMSSLGLATVFGTVDDDHKASIRVLEKAGFRFATYDYDESGRYSVYSTSTINSVSVAHGNIGDSSDVTT